jgi:MFS transporter, ACS family, tartrate transporter
LGIVDRNAVPGDRCGGNCGHHTLSHIGTSGAVWLLGVIKEATGSFPMALIPLALLQIAGIIAVLWINKRETPPVAVPSPVH